MGSVIKTTEEVVQEIAAALVQEDTEFIEQIAGEVLDTEYEYRGDNVWEAVAFCGGKVKWTEENNLASYRQGWSVFSRDDGELEIHSLDDPEGVAADLEIEVENRFKGPDRDRDAARYVQDCAQSGDVVCQKAIELLIAAGSPDVKLFDLKKTW